MKDLELAVLGVEEINEEELQNIDGGWQLPLALIGMAGVAAAWAFEKGEALGRDLAR